MNVSAKKCGNMVLTSAVAAGVLAVCGFTASASDLPEALAKYPATFKPPIVDGRDYVEVSPQDTLLRRFRYWGDYDKELAAYMRDAKAQAARTPPTKMKILYVVFKDLQVPATEKIPQGGKGKKKSAPAHPSDAQVKVMSVSDEQIEGIRQDCQNYADWVLAWSHGRCAVEWDIAVVRESIKYPPRPGWFWPFNIEDQLAKALAQYKDKYHFMIFFRVPTGGGIAYTQKTLLGAYTIALGPSSLGFVAHEMAHQIFDANMARVEGGLRLNVMHGFALYGWGGNDCGLPTLLNTYRYAYYYIYSPDMWSRFTTTPPAVPRPHEAFSGKAYPWAEVRDDRYFKLPRLTAADLNKLTGLTSIRFDAPMRDGYMLVDVSPADRSNILSKVVDASVTNAFGAAKAAAKAEKAAKKGGKAKNKKGGAKPTAGTVSAEQDGADHDGETGHGAAAESTAGDTELNNFINMMSESAIVLATKTGQWLIVKVDLADIYVDMNKISGRSDLPLPVYGYTAEGNRAMIVMKAPDGLPVPANEHGYFVK